MIVKRKKLLSCISISDVSKACILTEAGLDSVPHLRIIKAIPDKKHILQRPAPTKSLIQSLIFKNRIILEMRQLPKISFIEIINIINQEDLWFSIAFANKDFLFEFFYSEVTDDYKMISRPNTSWTRV